MTCDPLAYTGPGVQLDVLLIVAIACLAAGAIILLITRRRGRAAMVGLLLLIGGAAVSTTVATPVPAAADECPPANHPPVHELPDNVLTIDQTSVMTGLAPGILPVPIAGIVSNTDTENVDIVAIVVEITGVRKDLHAAPGICGAADYVLLNPLMAVGQTLASGGSTTFGGASIGFNNTSTNQDACKGATVDLRYTANPV